MTGALTPISRERIVMKALEQDCTHILFIDQDMTFREDALQRLIARDKDIVHGKFFSRYEPYEPCVWIAGKRVNVNEFSKIDHAGLAFTLIKMDVFKKIPQPWFEFSVKPIKGEDVLFHEKAKQYGIEAWIDPDVYVGHLALFAVRRNPEGDFKISRN
jgi:GT2 family glycosyltransferase